MTVTEADITAEIGRAALAMGQKKPNGEPDIQAWLAMVVKQDQVSLEIYKSDAVWPSVALKKIVGDNVQITEDDLKKGFEANYGPRARCRAIVLSSQRKAQEVWDKARDNPTLENFAKLAKEFSIDSASGAIGGEVPPIARHAGQPVLEREAFQLKKGELSGVIQLGENFVILWSEGFTEPIKMDIKEAKKYIYEDLREKKQRMAMAKEFERLQDMSEVDNFLAGTLHHPKIKADHATPPGDADKAYSETAERLLNKSQNQRRVERRKKTGPGAEGAGNAQSDQGPQGRHGSWIVCLGRTTPPGGLSWAAASGSGPSTAAAPAAVGLPPPAGYLESDCRFCPLVSWLENGPGATAGSPGNADA